MKIRRPKIWRSLVGREFSGPDATIESNCVLCDSSDMTSCEQVRLLFNRCGRLIAQRREGLTIDMKAVTHLDTKLLACLVAIYQSALASSVRVELLCSSSVLALAEVCRLGWLIERTSPGAA